MKRGIRNNNPLNIRHSVDQWQGASEEQKDKSFVQFKTMAYGYRAAWKTLQSYYDRLAKLISAMTCVECGIPMQRIDNEAIFQGYRLAFPENKEELDAYFIARDEYWNW